MELDLLGYLASSTLEKLTLVAMSKDEEADEDGSDGSDGSDGRLGCALSRFPNVHHLEFHAAGKTRLSMDDLFAFACLGHLKYLSLSKCMLPLAVTLVGSPHPLEFAALETLRASPTIAAVLSSAASFPRLTDLELSPDDPRIEDVEMLSLEPVAPFIHKVQTARWGSYESWIVHFEPARLPALRRLRAVPDDSLPKSDGSTCIHRHIVPRGCIMSALHTLEINALTPHVSWSLQECASSLRTLELHALCPFGYRGEPTIVFSLPPLPVMHCVEELTLNLSEGIFYAGLDAIAALTAWPQLRTVRIIRGDPTLRSSHPFVLAHPPMPPVHPKFDHVSDPTPPFLHLTYHANSNLLWPLLPRLFTVKSPTWLMDPISLAGVVIHVAAPQITAATVLRVLAWIQRIMASGVGRSIVFRVAATDGVAPPRAADLDDVCQRVRCELAVVVPVAVQVKRTWSARD
ncbi:hypothetical protein GGF32_007011 [Allomyces javanicus]|nr:hypothetical protein GGF32_007011 [Allomyces javanicus]